MFEPPIAPDATDIAGMIRRKEITALEAVDDAIARSEAMQPQLNFMVAPMREPKRTTSPGPSPACRI